MFYLTLALGNWQNKSWFFTNFQFRENVDFTQDIYNSHSNQQPYSSTVILYANNLCAEHTVCAKSTWIFNQHDSIYEEICQQLTRNSAETKKKKNRKQNSSKWILFDRRTRSTFCLIFFSCISAIYAV